MKIYNISQLTGEFVSIGTADESPLEPGAWLIPAGAVTEEPPKVANRKIAVWKNDKWSVLDDWRGYQYWSKEDGKEHIIGEIGERPPKGHLTERPPLSVDEIEDLRVAAYADPANGSYRHFMEALRLLLIGEEKESIEKHTAMGETARTKIQEDFPYGK